MSKTLTATSDAVGVNDSTIAALLLGLALVSIVYLLRRTTRVRNAPAAATPRDRAIAAADSVENHGRDVWFKCSCCKQRRLERGLPLDEFLDRLTDPTPICRGCVDSEIALFEQDLAS